jgi:threonine dehydrogenase-like Zn-dependent dehydrogenase
MTEKSIAAVAVAPRKIELLEFPLPEIGDDDALMRVESVGLCGTDWHFYQGPSRIEFPIILGHECVGRIDRIGKKAAERWKVREGDRVVIEEPFPCGSCKVCRTVNYQLCKNGGRYGAIPTTVKPSLWGGFSQYMYLHPNSQIYKISENVPSEEAPLFIPVSNGIRWVQQVGGLGIGDTVVIQGPGQHGLGCVIAAKEAGAGCIIVIGLTKDAKRMEIAKQIGADFIINVEKEDPIERVMSITGGQLADVVIDVTVGAPKAFNLALDVVTPGGTVVLAGKHQVIPEFHSDKIFHKEITIKGVYGRDYRSVVPAIKLLESQKYPLHIFSTHTFSLSETDRALRTFAREEHSDIEPLHVVIKP